MKSQPKRAFHIASEPEIKAGEVSDVYFERTVEILRAKGLHKRVKAEIRLKSFPQTDWTFGVLAGIEEAAALLEGLPVDVWAMDEGTLFGPEDTVLLIEGVYPEWAKYETALLGFLCQASGIATKAARCKRAAGDRQVISFGARRMHPALAPMIERNAFVGGCDGVAVTKSAELIDADPTGTIPHALVLLFGDTVEALRAFHEVIDPKVRRVALIDTLQDEKFEAIRVAKALGRELYAVRLDTPSSRRGDFFKILEEVRWELDLRGFNHVKILASGGIDEYEILKLNSLVDGYGVGARLRARHHGDRGGADGQARQALRGQAGVAVPGRGAEHGAPRRRPRSGGSRRPARGGAAQAADRGWPPRARPAAAAHAARVRDGADGAHRHHGAGSRTARRLLAEWASSMRSSPTSARSWLSSSPTVPFRI